MLHSTEVCYFVPGSPLSFTVADPTNVSVSGEGIDSVRCHKPTHFTINSPAAKRNDLDVKITGELNRFIVFAINIYFVSNHQLTVFVYKGMNIG